MESYEYKKSLANNMLWNGTGTLFYCGCQWLLTVFVVYFKGGYSDAGVLSLAMSISNVLFIVACLNLRNFQVSELDGRFSDGDFLINRVLASMIALALCICVVTHRGYGGFERLCICLFMLFKISEALADVLHGIDQKAWRLDIAGKSYIMRGFAILFSIASGMLLGGNLIVTIAFMTFSVYGIVYFYDYRQCKKLSFLKVVYNRNNTLTLVRIGFPLALSSILLNLIAVFPRFQIEEQYGKELLGVFASISTPTVLVTQLSNFIFSPLMGIFAECRKKRDKKRLNKLLVSSFGATAIIGVTAIIAGKFLGERVLILLFKESIREYVYLLIPIIYTAILMALIWFLCGLLTVFRDYCGMAVLTCIALLLCFISAPPLIEKRQLTGAVWSLLAALILETLMLGARLAYLLKWRERLL